MCRYILHTELEFSSVDCIPLEEALYKVAVKILGSKEGDVEAFWPAERLSLDAPVLTIDAEFTVGKEEGDIPLDQNLFAEFARQLLATLCYAVPIPGMKLGDQVAVWVRPDTGNSIYLMGKLS